MWYNRHHTHMNPFHGTYSYDIPLIGNSDAMFVRLLQSLHVSHFNLTQWPTVLTYLNFGLIYGDILIFQGVVIPLPGCKG